MGISQHEDLLQRRNIRGKRDGEDVWVRRLRGEACCAQGRTCSWCMTCACAVRGSWFLSLPCSDPKVSSPGQGANLTSEKKDKKKELLIKEQSKIPSINPVMPHVSLHNFQCFILFALTCFNCPLGARRGFDLWDQPRHLLCPLHTHVVFYTFLYIGIYTFSL